MRLAPLLLLAGLCLGASLARRDDQQPTELSPFRKGSEFVFAYNAQIASGLVAQSEEDAAEPQQKAITRIQAQAKISFSSDRHGQLRLQQIRFGQLNEGQLAQPEKVAPLSIFEQKQIPEEKRRQLEQPCQFSYADGVIERVQFSEQDDAWSKNIKRAVLNMIQLNLKRNNAQGLRTGDEQQNEEEQDEQNQLSKMAKTFSIPEITVEGACQTVYTVNPSSKQQQQNSNSFNVTKSVDFQQCQKIADVAYGFQTEQQQPQCAQCQQYWYQQQQQQKNGQDQTGQQQPSEQHPCSKCDPKEVKEQKLDRSTTLRYELVQTGDNGKYAIKRCQLLSHYVYKNMKTDSGKYGSAMHTVVSADLKLRQVQQTSENVQGMGSSGKDESLMFSNEWDVDVKRFYMFGDDEFGKSGKQSPFNEVPKVQQAEQALRKLAQTLASDKQKGIELQQGLQLQRLTEMLRMCSQQELRKVEQQTSGGQSAQLNGQEKQKAKHIFADALAICGTRNCIQLLAEKIQKKEIWQPKAVQALKTLGQVPAPSDEIVKQVERLCKHESVHRQPAVKQACWLTFGALVNELCSHSTQKGAQKTVFGAQSGFDKQELCPLDKKQQYKESILNLYQNADSIYQKVMALTALGNAGLDIAVGDLEQIIKDPRNQPTVRCKAIDALRRLRTQMPRKIQQTLLPIFQNSREQPEVRAAAFSIIMSTLPEPQVIDQITYTIAKASNKQVQAFAYRTMKSMARSQKPVEQQIAKHIKNALKLANVDEQQLRNSGKWQIPIYSQEQQEGLFVTLAQMVSSRSGLPAYNHIQIDSHTNDQFSINDVKLYMSQEQAEKWYQNAMSKYGQSFTRGERRSSDYSSSLRSIYSALGIKSRSRSQSMDYFDTDMDQQQQQQQDQQPFAMLCIRTGDVDHGFVALEERIMPEAIRQVLNGQAKPSLSRLMESAQQEHQLRGAIATNLAEKQAKIPTSCGLPLRILTSVSLLASVDGQAKMNTESARLESPLGVQAQINAHCMASLVHLQKMEAWTPFLVSGVESIRSVEINIPAQFEISASKSQGLTLKMKLPRTKTTLLGAHSLPLVYTAEVEPKSGLTREPRHVRAIHNPKLERMQKEVSHTVGQKNLGIPLHIHGHYHWPSQPLSYQQFLQMVQATENVVHVTYQPNEESPREAVFRIQGNTFQKHSGQMTDMKDFYGQGQIQHAFDSQEMDDYEMEEMSQQSRRQKLNKFLGQFNPKQQYKHSLKLSAQTVGGRKECKAQCEINTQCDSRLQVCNVEIEAQRTPMNEESQKWTMKAQAQLVMPETVQSVEEISQLESQQNKFLCKAEAQWGSDRKQTIRVKVQGEQAKKNQWRQHEQQNRQIRKRAAFLNMYNLEAEYQNLKPQTLNAAQRTLELVKSYYFWNSASQLTPYNQGSQSQSSGKVVATMLIDPITQKHANISVKTPSQQVRLQQIELPTQCRPFPLVRQQRQQTHSISQFIQSQDVNTRAECSVDGRRVDTFDDVEYSAPLSTNCYSVLAKDCGSDDEPQFVVLMKALQSGINGQKKLKVITPEQNIECQPKQGSSQQQRIQCKINGQTVQQNDEEYSVQYNNVQQSDVTIHVSGVSVRFNGRKAWLKVSPMYKNTQCGLCGHYDDSDDNEWRMSNNQMANNLQEFHRSYSLQSELDGEQCSEQELDQFYQQNKNIFSGNQLNSDEDQDQDDEEQDWQNEQFNGDFESDDDDFYSQSRNQKYNSRTQQPEKVTKVIETSHEVCFSKEPVKQCPSGTIPSNRFSTNSQEDQQDDDEEQNGTTKTVGFACVSRSSPEARRLLRQIRQGEKVVEVSQRSVSFNEKVRQPEQCQRSRY